MRSSTLLLLPATLLASIPHAVALQLPNLQPFLTALPDIFHDYIPISTPNDTAAPHDLLRRQSSDTCPAGFNSCANLGAASLCCVSDAVCSADSAGNVACCPSGAACTGTIGGIITGGTVDPSGGLVGVGSTATGVSASTTSFQFPTSTTGDGGLVPAATSGDGGFIVDGGETVAVPGAAPRAVQLPAIAHAIIYVLELLPI